MKEGPENVAVSAGPIRESMLDDSEGGGLRSRT